MSCVSVRPGSPSKPGRIRLAALARSLGSPSSSASTPRRRTWVKRAEVDAGARPGVRSADAAGIAELEREVRELRRANEILKTASAFFAAAELDRKLK